jgi:hypothetical protein
MSSLGSVDVYWKGTIYFIVSLPSLDDYLIMHNNLHFGRFGSLCIF